MKPKNDTQPFTRINENLRKDTTITPLHKLIIGFLETYQSNPDGTQTKKYFYNSQEFLAIELGVSLRTLKTGIQVLEEKGIIYQTQKSKIDNRPQYKNRKAIILVDSNNPLPLKETSQPIQEVQYEKKVDIIASNEAVEVKSTIKLEHYNTRLGIELDKRIKLNELIDEKSVIQYIKKAFIDGKIIHAEQLSIENINKIIDKFKIK
jgi:hypothetical protein